MLYLVLIIYSDASNGGVVFTALQEAIEFASEIYRYINPEDDGVYVYQFALANRSGLVEVSWQEEQ